MQRAGRAAALALLATGLIFGSTLALAQKSEPAPEKPAEWTCPHGENCPMGGPGMGRGMGMGPGMGMGRGMGPGPGAGGMGFCPMMMQDATVKVQNRDDGVTLTLTSSDPKVVRRLQKRAEILRLMNELEQEETNP
jgi:hypothetical protein